jgi:NADPH:quinone reductase
MRIVDVRNPGNDYQLALAEVDDPHPGARDVVIKVEAAGVNRADLLQAGGRYPPPPGASQTLGLEVAGEVVLTGAAVTQFHAGDKVCALLSGGGYAEFACAAEACVLPVPRGVAVRDAAALPEAFFTVWANLVEMAHLKPDDSVLVHGGSSGIGTAAIQLCAARGQTVFATAGSADKCAACVSLGAKRAINYRSEDFVAAVLDETGGRGVDVILDMVGGDYIARNFQAAAMWGRIVNVAFQSGTTATVDFAPMMAKRLTLAATTLRSRSDAEKGVLRDAVLEQVWPLIEAGRIKPVIDRVFPLVEAGAAHARMKSGEHIGKILLSV